MCVIVQDKESIVANIPVPSFLTNGDRSQCQVKKAETEMLRCGQTDVYIKPECVCSFYNVYEAVYHAYSSCPDGAHSDVVTQLNCSDCKKYSLNNNGPCINGGTLTCIEEEVEVAPDITCKCPPNYGGMFCENKIENVTRICEKISNSSSDGLPNCALTSRECVTYSRRKRYAYKCPLVQASQNTKDYPLCMDTEDLKEVSVVDSQKTISVACASTPGLIWAVLMFLSSLPAFIHLLHIMGSIILQ
ncbi:uncharacterized protein LOC144627105 isoform X2 [Crassostrea virginica]